MTYEEHAQIGNTMKTLQRQLADILNCFRVSSREARLIGKIISGGGPLGELRSLLDDMVCGDFPDARPERAYYGPIEAEKASLGGPLRPIGKK